MPRRKIRFVLFWKLFFASTALSTAATLGVAAAVDQHVAALVRRQADQRLSEAAQIAGLLVAGRWPSDKQIAEAQSITTVLAGKGGLRFTLIDADGKVLADTARAVIAGSMENHRNRPEVIQALSKGEAWVTRISPSLSTRQRYYALRIMHEGRLLGILRTSRSAASLASEAADSRRRIWSIAIFASVLALPIAAWGARRVAGPVASLATAAEAIVIGEPSTPLRSSRGRSDEIGVLGGALSRVRDQLAHGERQLRSTSQTQSTVLEAMGESVIAVDGQLRISFANASAGRALGFDPARVHGVPLLEAVRSHELHRGVHDVLQTRSTGRFELQWRGTPARTFDVRATPLPGERSSGVVLVLRDVTELKRLDQIRQEFVANASHELKTPLSSIKAYTETLLAGAAEEPEHRDRFLARIDEQAGRLDQIIQDMLSLARIEAGSSAMQLTAVPVAEVVDRCIRDFEPLAAAREVNIEDHAVDSTIRVTADERSLGDVLRNLIDNAVKYTPAGGRVTVRCRIEGTMAAIEVIDTGIGIAPEHHNRLFERFYRVDRARSRALGGTGLGLAIVKHIMHSMGGNVSVNSALGKGSTFTVRLPLAWAPVG